MAESYFPFPSVNGDRKYGVGDWVGYFEPLLTNGIFEDGLAVTANGLNVTVAEGSANINGYRYTNTADLTLNLTAADSNFPRIDRVIIRWDKVNRKMTAMVLTGIVASSPSAPTLTRTATVYDLCLANITVAAGAATITVEDTRADNGLCGNVSLLLNVTPDYIATSISLPTTGTALTPNTMYMISTSVGTYSFTPPATGWAHGFFETGATVDISFSGSAIGKIPVFKPNTKYEFDVLNGTWAFAEVLTQ